MRRAAQRRRRIPGESPLAAAGSNRHWRSVRIGDVHEHDLSRDHGAVPRHVVRPGVWSGLSRRSTTNSSSPIFGLYVEQLKLNDAPGGEGEYRGGKGIVLDYVVRSDGCFYTCAYTRNKQLPWPLEGGREGSPNRAEVIRREGTVEQHAVVTALE
jgi:hypothetical protein